MSDLQYHAQRRRLWRNALMAAGLLVAWTGCRAARNQLIKDVMRDYGYLEHMGMGVPRKMIRGMRNHNGTYPDLIEAEESFTVRLLAGPPSAANEPAIPQALPGNPN